jgi:hypothetical protein
MKTHSDLHKKPKLTTEHTEHTEFKQALSLYSAYAKGGVPPALGFLLFRVFRGSGFLLQLQPVVAPQVWHFMQAPLRTRVRWPHSGQGSPV